VITRRPGKLIDASIVRDQSAAFAVGAEILGRIEAEGSGIGQPANAPAAITRAMSLAGVFDHGNTARARDGEDRIEIGRAAVQVDGKNDLRTRADVGFQKLGIEIGSGRVNVHEDRPGAAIGDGGGGGDERVRGGDDFVARLHAGGKKGEMQGTGAGVQSDTVLRLAEGCKFLFEPLDFFAKNERGVATDAVERGENFLTQGVVLRFEIEVRNFLQGARHTGSNSTAPSLDRQEMNVFGVARKQGRNEGAEPFSPGRVSCYRVRPMALAHSQLGEGEAELRGRTQAPSSATTNLMTLSVVMAAYNERPFVEEILRRIQATGLEKEIIIVEDHSTDGTREFLQELERRQQAGEVETDILNGGARLRLDKLRFLFQDKNRGKGAALRRGFAEASGDIVLVQDADLEYDPRDYPKLLEPILDGRAHVVYGSRFLGGPQRVHFFWHYVGNKFLTLLSDMLTNLKLTDIETCYKVFRREVLNKMILRSNRFGFEPEFTAKIAKGRWRIYEVPISYAGRSYEEGKKITWRDGVVTLFAILRYHIFD
jgi:Glycosyl transferase family 2